VYLGLARLGDRQPACAGVELASAPTGLLSNLLQPKVQNTDGAIVANGPTGNIRPLAVSPPLPDDEPAAPATTTADKTALLAKALSRYQAVIEVQQRQLETLRKSLMPRTADEASRGNR
jgi:hypothetical protein